MQNNIFENIRYIKGKQTFDKEHSIQDCAPMFRKNFYLDKENVQNAKIYVQGIGYAYYYINGQKISEDLFLSPQSNYNDILWYNVYDVSKLIKKGKNTIAVICGNGFYNVCTQTTWGHQNAEYRDNPKFILRLEIDGETVVKSDNSWVCQEDSYITYNQVYTGEKVDFRKYEKAWTEVNFDDSAWKPAVIDLSPPKGKFMECKCEPLREKEYLQAVQIYQNGNKYVLDFGKNLSGYVRVNISGKAGTRLILRHAEEIFEDKTLKQNGNERYCFAEGFQTDEIILGDEEILYSPIFTYHGFRYVEIEGLDRRPNATEFIAVFVHQDFARKTHFECGDALFNYIYNGGVRSTYSNTHYALTDCPTREKLGWINDTQASCEQTFINFDIAKFYEKWMEDIKAAMREDGVLPCVVPSFGWSFKFGSVVDAALFEIPFRYYEYTGNAKMLIDCLPYMYRNIEYYSKKIALKEYDGMLRDWLGGGTPAVPVPSDFIQRVLEIKHLRIIAVAEKLSGNQEKSLQALQKREEKRKLFIEEYYTENGECTVDTQASIAMSIGEGIYSNLETLKRQLIRRVEKDEFQITCGMTGSQYLYDALTLCGKSEYAYKLLKETKPGYASWFEQGATTLWECFKLENVSHNHHMYSCVVAWLFKGLLGIAPKASEDTLVLNPQFIKEMEYCKGYVTWKGKKIDLEWKVVNGGFEYSVSIPEGCSAVYQNTPLIAGKNTFFI